MRNSVKDAERKGEDAEKKAEKAKKRAKQIEAQAQERLLNLQNRCNQQIDGLNHELQRQASTYQETMKHMENRFREKLHQQDSDFKDYLRKQRNEFEKSLRNSHQNLQTQINVINEKMEVERRTQEEIAGYWINQSQKILDDIDSKYRHRLFASREWEMLSMRLSCAKDDLEKGSIASALTTSREVSFQAIGLQDKVIAAEWEWTKLYNHTVSNLMDAKERIAILESLTYVEQAENGEESVPARVDFWSKGALAEAKQKLETLENTTRSESDNFSSDELRSFIEQISVLDNSITEIKNSAADSYCASLLREEIGAEMEGRLPGWNLDTVLFEGEDERENLHLLFTHINGTDKLSLIVRGNRREETNVTADYFCNCSDGERHDEYVRQVNGAINGIDPGSVCRIDPAYIGKVSGDPSVLNVEEIKKKQQN